MSGTAAPLPPPRWRPPTVFGSHRTRMLVLVGLALYLLWSITSLQFDANRVMRGFARAADMFVRMVPPDFSRQKILVNGMLESIQIAVLATVIGALIGLPVGVCAARNLAPKPLYLASRGVIVVGRTFHELIIAIFFVKMFGFGPLAGVLTLGFGSFSFVAKMLAEDIENMKMGPIEALRASGAGFLQIVWFGVVPQVLVRQIGIMIYRLDSNLRHSTIIGVVGAGGIGQPLSAAFTKYDYDFAAAILICIAVLVALGEFASDAIRRRLR